jgi:hypothetical protein
MSEQISTNLPTAAGSTSAQATVTDPNPRQSQSLVFLLLAMFVVPAAITLSSVRVERPPFVPGAVEPTPYGYTISLLLWILPAVVIGLWLIPHERLVVPKKAFAITCGVTTLLGATLDFLFAHTFFNFPNPGATLGIPGPALGGPVPIEEYVFYLSGAIVLLLVYIWMDEYWLRAYCARDTRPLVGILGFHWPPVALGLALIAAATIYKNYFTATPGLPGYFIFLMLVNVIPCALFLPAVTPKINWRAFTSALFFVLLTSILWEATLAIPYGWWGYKPGPMIGIFIDAWTGLPIEATLLWIVFSYVEIILYVVVREWLASGKPLKVVLFGAK